MRVGPCTARRVRDGRQQLTSTLKMGIRSALLDERFTTVDHMPRAAIAALVKNLPKQKAEASRLLRKK